MTAGRTRLRDEDAGVLPVLAKAMRVTRPAEFTAVLRQGRRAGTKLLSVHLLIGADGSPTTGPDSSHVVPRGRGPAGARVTSEPAGAQASRPARAGFVVSSAVGNSVVRHRVTRRLREQVRPLLSGLPAGTDVVVRAFGPAATATSDQLAHDLRSALHRAHSR